MDVRELFVGEAQEAFREYVMQDDTLPRFMQEQLDAIRLIQERYAWFLDGIFAGKPFEKKKGQRKTSLAQQIEKKGLEPFVSGVSLGADSKVDAPKVNAQFCIRGTGREAEVVEKMYFDRLLDFVYRRVAARISSYNFCSCKLPFAFSASSPSRSSSSRET